MSPLTERSDNRPSGSDFADRVPPQNVDAEKSLLGSLMLDNQLIGEVLQELEPSSFYKPAHQLIFQVLVELHDAGKPIDAVIINDELEKRGILDKAGGTDYLGEIIGSVPSSAHAGYYSKIVKDKSILRNLISACTKIIKDAGESTGDPEALLDSAENAVLGISGKRNATGTLTVKEIINSAFDKIFNEEKRQQLMSGLQTGFRDLDNRIGGMHPSQLVIIAGRPSMGKTSFALNVAHHVAVNKHKGVLFFSFEMDSETIATNLVCLRARVNPFRLKQGQYTDEEYGRLLTEAGAVSESPLFIDDTTGLSIYEIRARARRFKADKDISLIMVDYLQLMEYRARGVDNRQQEIATLSRGFKSLARELKVPVVVLSQLNRSVEGRDTHRPRMSDLRESGAIEQDADVIMMLYRDEYYNENSKDKGVSEVIVAKQRNGPTGTTKLAFVKEQMKFADLAAREVDEEFDTQVAL